MKPLHSSYRLRSLSWVGFSVYSVIASADAQLTIERRITVGSPVPDRGDLVESFIIDNSGLVSLTGVSVTVNLSSPNASNPMWFGDMFASLTYGTASEDERMAVLFNRPGVTAQDSWGDSSSNLSQTYDVSGALAGTRLASDRWSLLVSDLQQGGIARLDSVSLSVTGSIPETGEIVVRTNETLSGDGVLSGQLILTSTSANASVAASIGEGDSLQLSGGMVGTANLVKQGSGELVIGSLDGGGGAGAEGPQPTNDYSGEIEVSEGSLRLVGSNALSSGASIKLGGDGVELRLDADAAVSNSVTLAAATTLSKVQVSSGDASISSVMQGAGGFEKSGAGTLTISGSNTHTGGTVVSAGILGITTGEALGAVSGALKLDGGTLVGAQVTSGDPVSAVTIAAARSLVLTNGKTSGMDAQTGLSLRYDGVIGEENGAGAAAGLRIGSSAARTGTVILGGNNTYQGATTVDFGKLILNGSTSASSAVGVSSGAILAGSGTVGGNITIASGGALAPGNSPGVLTVAGASNFASGSMFEWEIDTAQANPTTNRGVAYDGVNTTAVTGSGAFFKVMLTGTQDFTDDFWNQNRTWTDIFKSADGSSILSGWASVFSGGFQYSYNGQTVAPTSQGFFTATGSSLTWSAVPEPSNLLAGILAASALLRRRRNA